MTGDLQLFTPGSTADARVVADADGNVAERGDAVEIVGESRDGTPLVALSSGGRATIGHLKETPFDFDEDTTYEADDVVGEAGVYVRHYIDWLEDADGDLSAADLVTFADGGGVTALDEAGGDTGADLAGVVYRSVARGEYRAGKVAVVRYK